jgi:histidyl-tRNA synthetase
LQLLRNAGFKSELYPEAVKLKKQFEFAEKKGIPYLLIYGEKEFANEIVEIKNLQSGQQEAIAVANLAQFKHAFSGNK